MTLLSRAALRAPLNPREKRIVHIGLGAFHRAHQAWYTQHADDGWGIVAFTGRSPKVAATLNDQDCLYTLVTRGEAADSFEVIDSIIEAHDGADLVALAAAVAHAQTSIITLTVTEAGYHTVVGAYPARLDAESPAILRDLANLRGAYASDASSLGVAPHPSLTLETVPARLVMALAARRSADGWPLAVVSCDNLPGNGDVTRAVITELAALVDPLLAQWITANVSFVSTSIDRITPRSTPEDSAAVEAATGFTDNSPVVTEPFTSWVLEGDFPTGRPAWEKAGAEFVENVEPFERRKLWLLNGAHSLLAYAGQLRGHATVDQAIADPVARAWVEEFWDEAANHLGEPTLNIPEYRAALLARFENPRIAHNLAQIAMDGSLKLKARAVPVYEAERAASRTGTAALRPLAAWCDYLVRTAAERIADENTAAEDATSGNTQRSALPDPNAAALERALQLNAPESSEISTTHALIAVIDRDLAADQAALHAIHQLRGTFTAPRAL